MSPDRADSTGKRISWNFELSPWPDPKPCSLAAWSRPIRCWSPNRHSLRCHGFMVHRVTTAHAHQCCIFQSYAKTVRSRMKFTMKLNMREPASMTTDTWSRRVTSSTAHSQSAKQHNGKWNEDPRGTAIASVPQSCSSGTYVFKSVNFEVKGVRRVNRKQSQFLVRIVYQPGLLMDFTSNEKQGSDKLQSKVKSVKSNSINLTFRLDIKCKVHYKCLSIQGGPKITERHTSGNNCK